MPHAEPCGSREIEIEAEPALITVDQALAAEQRLMPDYTFRKGDSAAALAAGPRRLSGTLRIGGQDHFYLEGQIAFAMPGEDDDARAFVLAASERGPGHHREDAQAAAGRRDRRSAAHGRRLRRQGDTGRAVGGDSRRSPRGSPAVPASCDSIVTTT